MVEEDGIRQSPPGGCWGGCRNYVSSHIRTVVTADDDDGGVDDNTVVDKQTDAGIAVELPGLWYAAVILMVPQTGIDGCLQAPELLGHAFLDERAYGAVNDVTSNQYEVRVFGIDEVHPAGQFPPRIVVTDVQVAHHDNLVVMRQWLVGLQIQRHAYLILIMDIAVEEDAYHRHQDGSGRPSVLIEP